MVVGGTPPAPLMMYGRSKFPKASINVIRNAVMIAPFARGRATDE